MKRCTVCGFTDSDDARFCEHCGGPMEFISDFDAPIPMGGDSFSGGYTGNPYTYSNPTNNNYNQSYAGNTNQIATIVVNKTRTSATIWLIIAILQIILGIVEACFGYGIVVILLGIWNIVQSSNMRKNAAVFAQNPAAAVSYYESQNTMTIVFLFINFFFGSLIGIIASIYDLTVISYVKRNRMALLNR